MSSSSSTEEARSFASWKFDLLRTVNADPLCKGCDHKLIDAYLNFTNQNDRCAFLANSMAGALTGIGSATTLSKSRQRLGKLGVLNDTGRRTADGAVWYELANPRREIVEDHIRLKLEATKEHDAYRKSEDRRKARNRKRAASVPPENGTPEPVLHSTNRRDTAPVYGHEHLEPTPGYLSPRDRRVSGGRTGSDHWGIYGSELRPWAEIEAKGGGK